MRHLLFGLVAVTSAAACKVSLQDAPQDGPPLSNRTCKVSTASICMQAEAQMVSDFTWLQQNMFATNCSGKDCHGAPEGGNLPSGEIVLAEGYAYKTLLGKEPMDSGLPPLVAAKYDPGFHLVEPGKPQESYLLYILHGLPADQATAFLKPPDDVGFMPQNNNTLCCQKLDAVERWIAAGANP